MSTNLKKEKELFNEINLKLQDKNMKLLDRQAIGFCVFGIFSFSILWIVIVLLGGYPIDEQGVAWWSLFLWINGLFLVGILVFIKQTEFVVFDDGILYPPNRFISYFSKKKIIIKFSQISKLSIKEIPNDNRKDYYVLQFKIDLSSKKSISFMEPIFDREGLYKILREKAESIGFILKTA